MIVGVRSITRIESLGEFLVVFINDYPQRKEAAKVVLETLSEDYDLSEEVASVLPSLVNSLNLPVEARAKTILNVSIYLGKPIGKAFPVPEIELITSIVETIPDEWFLILESDDEDAIDILKIELKGGKNDD